jgi:hypothetical protein
VKCLSYFSIKQNEWFISCIMSSCFFYYRIMFLYIYFHEKAMFIGKDVKINHLLTLWFVFCVTNPIWGWKTELDYSIKCASAFFSNPKQVSIGICQISAGFSNPDDGFWFGLHTRIQIMITVFLRRQHLLVAWLYSNKEEKNCDKIWR